MKSHLEHLQFWKSVGWPGLRPDHAGELTAFSGPPSCWVEGSLPPSPRTPPRFDRSSLRMQPFGPCYSPSPIIHQLSRTRGRHWFSRIKMTMKRMQYWRTESHNKDGDGDGLPTSCTIFEKFHATFYHSCAFWVRKCSLGFAKVMSTRLLTIYI